MSGAENGAERAEIGWSRAEREVGVAKNNGAGVERGAGHRGAGTEREAS